jgi:hypothetical protein
LIKQLNLSLPCWQDYRELLQQLKLGDSAQTEFPSPAVLNVLISKTIRQRTGKSVSFVPAEDLPAVAYEQHIFDTGEICTRQDNWHDLFNALVWARFPRTKSAMNASHHAEMSVSSNTMRGPVRDALTLFDECGVVVVGSHPALLHALAKRDWQVAFCEQRQAWQKELGVFVPGHALLEKFLDPYKAITAQALILQVSPRFMQLDRETQRERIDEWLAHQVQAQACLRSSRELSPLPLMGIPGWWEQTEQGEAFYADKDVFRPPAKGFSPAPILSMD